MSWIGKAEVKALVTAGNIVIHLDAEYIRIGSAADNLAGVAYAQIPSGKI